MSVAFLASDKVSLTGVGHMENDVGSWLTSNVGGNDRTCTG